MADGGASLFFREVGGAQFVAERAHARADRAAGDEHDFLARRTQGGDLRDQLLQLRRINLFPAVGEHARAEFHDDAGGGFKRITMHAVKLGKTARAKKAKVLATI